MRLGVPGGEVSHGPVDDPGVDTAGTDSSRVSRGHDDAPPPKPLALGNGHYLESGGMVFVIDASLMDCLHGKGSPVEVGRALVGGLEQLPVGAPELDPEIVFPLGPHLDEQHSHLDVLDHARFHLEFRNPAVFVRFQVGSGVDAIAALVSRGKRPRPSPARKAHRWFVRGPMSRRGRRSVLPDSG